MAASGQLEKMKPVWDELSELVHTAQRKGLRRMSAEDLARMDKLYRLSTIHLAQLQARSTNPHLVHNLNRLVAKAHSLIYISPRRSTFKRIFTFYLTGFSRAVIRTAPYQAVAVLLFVLGSVAGYYASMHDYTAAYALMMPDPMRMPGASAEQLVSVLRSGRDQSGGAKVVFMSFLLQHNTKVGFTAFAGGILAGVPTVFLMMYTGGFLGAFTAIHMQNGLGAEWWAWILPHGVTELGAAILCGGAGLMLGMAVLRPGELTRRASIVAAGREGLNIAMGVVPLFILAGFIESFVRQSYMTTGERFAFAFATAVFWAVYFGYGALLEIRAKRAEQTYTEAEELPL